jgi:dTDP-4-dehydrorhamnose 3,5-epimerase
MKIEPTSIPDVLVLEPGAFEDSRGFFMEIYHRDRYAAFGIDTDFVQDNLSVSHRGTIRGLHFQHPHGQAKLVQVLDGEVFDVAVDVRRGSPGFGEWTCVELSGVNRRQLFIPEGFAHGFCVVSDRAILHYKCGDFYTPSAERGIIWDDPDLGVSWPASDPLLSAKDASYGRLRDLPRDFFPVY